MLHFATQLSCLSALILASALLALAKDKPTYPLTATVIRTDVTSVTGTPGAMRTACATNGDDVRCQTFSPVSSTTVTGWQLLHIADGPEFNAICHMGIGRNFAMGAGAGMNASVGVGGVVHQGCNMPPGDYPARYDKGALHIMFKGKDFKMDVAQPVKTSRGGW